MSDDGPTYDPTMRQVPYGVCGNCGRTLIHEESREFPGKTFMVCPPCRDADQRRLDTMLGWRIPVIDPVTEIAALRAALRKRTGYWSSGTSPRCVRDGDGQNSNRGSGRRGVPPRNTISVEWPDKWDLERSLAAIDAVLKGE